MFEEVENARDYAFTLEFLKIKISTYLSIFDGYKYFYLEVLNI